MLCMVKPLMVLKLFVYTEKRALITLEKRVLYESTYVTRPGKRDQLQVGTKYTISQNGTYLEFCVQYFLSVSCKMLPMKLLCDDKNFTCIALADH